MNNSPRVVVLALDGADPETLRRHIADGKLPALAAAISRSREVDIRTEGELFLTSIWPSFASGLSVSSHGLHAFRPLKSGTLEIREGTDFSMPTPFWETAARAGVRTCVLDIPLYGPPVATAGLDQLSFVEWGAHPPLRPPGSCPPHLVQALSARHGQHPWTGGGGEGAAPRTRDEVVSVVAHLRAGVRARAAVMADLVDEWQPDLLVASFSELHTAGHDLLFYETRDRHPDGADPAYTGTPVREVYEAIDAACGELLARFPPHATVLLTCLGGFRITHAGPFLLSDVLVRLGMTAFPAGIRVRKHVSTFLRRLPSPIGRALRRTHAAVVRPPTRPGVVLDWSKTRAFALHWAYDGYLRLNLRGREPNGIVAEGTERETVLAEIEAAVRALRISGSGELAARAIVRAQEQFPGPAAAELPDLMILWNSSHPFPAIESETLGRIENRSATARAAHGPRGRMFASGPLVSRGPTLRGIRDIDIAPTVLELLGVSPPSPLDGRPVVELLTPVAT